jgi:hypothetical protein
MKRWHTLTRMKYFERIGTTASTPPKAAATWKKSPLLHKHPAKKSKMHPLWRKLSGVLFWRQPGKKEAHSSPQVTCTSTPENTASLLDLDDLSVCVDDSYMFQSFSAESNDPLMRGGGGGGGDTSYPYWEHRPTVVNETLSLGSSDSSEIGRLEARNTRLRRSLMAVLKKTRSRSTASTSYSPTSDEPNDAMSQSTEHFSISEVVPPASTYQCPCVTISVTVGNETPGMASNSSASSSYTMSYSRTDRSGSFTNLSLDQFMAEKQKESESIMTGPIALADVDGASVGSACLDVAFDGDYPQLVLTPSHDGTLSRMTGSVTHTDSLQRATLGASYPHPCSRGGSNRSVGSFDTAKKNTSCTPRWLNENIDRVWKQIDRNTSDLDGSASNYSDSYFQSESDQSRDVPDEMMSEHDEQRINEFIYRYTKGGSMDLSVNVTEASLSDDASEDMEEYILEDDVHFDPVEPEDPKEAPAPKEGFTWVKDLCSFSAEESALSITSMLEKDVIHPLLKPICHLVEATEIPESAMCGSKYRRPPLSRHVNSSKYRMAPQTSQPRLPTHQN